MRERKPVVLPDLGEGAGEPGTLSHLGRDFLEWMATMNYSSGTVVGRAYQLRTFFNWVRERDVTRPEQVGRPLLERYQRWLYRFRSANGRPLSFKRQHDLLVGLRVFFKWLARRNHIPFSPAADLELPRLGKRLPRNVLTLAEVERVMAGADERDPLGLRDRTIMEVLYSTGMRRSELMRLELYDVDESRGTVMIREGKGKKDRVVPIAARALRWVDRYVLEVRPRLVAGADLGFLFLSGRGEPLNEGGLTRLVRRYVEAAGVRRPGACHLFRHAAATGMLENGADIRYIQQLLGHADLKATEVYTHVSIQKLKEVHEATHPAAGGGKGLRRRDKGEADLLAALDDEAEWESDDSDGDGGGPGDDVEDDELETGRGGAGGIGDDDAGDDGA